MKYLHEVKNEIMNAGTLDEENEIMIKDIINLAKRVSRVMNISLKEAIELGRRVKMKHANSYGQKAGIDIRHNKALKLIE